MSHKIVQYMNFLKFLISKAFLKQLGFALGILIIIVFLTMQWLNFSTNQGDFKTVPDLSKLSFEEAKAKLAENDLRYKLTDTSNYNPDFPAFSVIEQDPVAGEKVKENRKIYLKINPSKYREITIPYVIQITRRTAESTLNAVGFGVEKVTYKDNIGKDMVLGLQYKGKPVKPGETLPKTSKIELILGNGKRPGASSVDENEEE